MTTNRPSDSSLLWAELHQVTAELAQTRRDLADCQTTLAGLARKWASRDSVRRRLAELEPSMSAA